MLSMLLACSLTVAASPQEDIAQLEQLIEQQADAEGEQAALRELYQKTLSALKNRQQYQERADTLQKQLERQPDELKRQQQLLAQARNTEQDRNYRDMGRSDLEQAIILKRASVLELEQQQQEKAQQIELNKQKQLSLREQLAELKQSSPSLPPMPPEQSGRAFNDARLQLQNALQESKSSHVRALELELLALPGQTELAELQLEQLQLQLEQASLDLEAMLNQRKQMLREELETTLSNLKEPVNAALQHPQLSALLQDNRRMSKEVSDLLERASKTQQQRTALEHKLDLLSKGYKVIQQQLELKSYSASYDLRRFTLELSRPADLNATHRALNELRLSSLEFSRLGQAGTDALADSDLSEVQRDYHAQLTQNQQALRNQLQDGRQQLLSELSQLLAVKEQFNERLQQARHLINRQLLWLPVSPPVSWHWPGEIAAGLDLFKTQVQQLQATPMLAEDANLGSLLGFTILLLILAFFIHRYQKNNRQRWQQQIGNVVHDRFGRTLRLLLSGVLVAAPVPALLLLLRSYSLNTGHPSHMLFSQLLLLWALSLQCYLMALLWLKVPDGLLCGHFPSPPCWHG